MSVKKVKLTVGQSKIIRTMKKGATLYYSKIYESYRMCGEAKNRHTIAILMDKGLLIRDCPSDNYSNVSLTELGENIEL
jgi:hypothetical protein